MSMFFDEDQSEKVSNIDLTNESNIEIKKKIITFEFIVNISKYIAGVLCIVGGLFLIYNGVKQNNYSVELSSSIKFKDTPIGVIVIVLGVYLLTKTNLNIKS